MNRREEAFIEQLLSNLENGQRNLKIDIGQKKKNWFREETILKGMIVDTEKLLRIIRKGKERAAVQIQKLKSK